MNLRVAGIQMPVTNDISENVKNICTAIKHAAEENADILLTPEGAVSGYRHDFERESVKKAVEFIASYAQLSRVGLALGTCYVEDNDYCYNQIRFYTPDGDYLGFHAKILRCGTLTDPPVGEINNYHLADLRTFRWLPDLKVGGLICNDLWANPECTPVADTHLSQQLARMGARVIFHAVNGGRNGSEWSQVAWRYHEANLKMRARAGEIWIVTVDSSTPLHLPCSAPGGVISPQGNWVCRTEPQGSQFFVYTLQLD
jgi:predicted amidohydrolase